MRQASTRLLPVSVALGLFIGLTFASLFPGTTRAASQAQYWFDIPVRANGGSAQIACGWHWTACTNNDDGRALDWDSYPSPLNYNVYVRGAGYAPTYSYALLSYAVPRSAPGEFTTCQYNTIVDVYQSSNAAWQVSLGYTHTVGPSSWFYLPYGNPQIDNTGSVVATMATSADPSGCGWSGAHVHAWECACSPIVMATNWSGYPYDNNVHCCYYNRTWVHYMAWWY